MKYLVFLLFSSIVLANNYPFLNYGHNFNKAIHKAIKEKKLLMLFEVQNHCKWCAKEAKETFYNKAIQKEVQKSFIPLLLNINEDFIPTPYKPEAVPAVYFINPNENEEVWRAVGYKNILEMLEVFKKAKQSYANDLEDEAEY